MEDLRIENTEQPIEQVGEKGKVSDIIVSIENKTLILERGELSKFKKKYLNQF